MNIAFEAMKFAREVRSPESIAAEAACGSKACSGCKEEKLFREFNQCAKARHGLHNHCRSCQQETRRRHYQDNADAAKVYGKAYMASERGKEAWGIRYAKNREAVLEANRIRRKSPHARAMANAAKRSLEESNPAAKLARNARVRVRKALLGINRSASTLEMIGCSQGALKEHLESLFEPGMSWANYGYRGWHMDHIRPCASFDLSDPEQQRQCFKYTNLKPSWRVENQSKGGAWPDVDLGALGIARGQL